MLIAAILYALAVGLICYCVVTHAVVAGVLALCAGLIALVLSRPVMQS